MEYEHKRRIDIFESLSAIYLLGILALSILVAGVGGHQLFLVLVGFFPSVLTIIISLVIHEEFSQQKKALWLIPLFILIAFYLLGSSGLPLLEAFDIEVLTGLNFLLSLLYVLMVFGVLKKTTSHKPHDKQKQMLKRERRPQTIEEYVTSIEDKSKAINFAIGRIYSKYHGGTKEMREQIRISPDWYNEFSSIGIGSQTVDYTELSEIIGKFEKHFKTFEKTEKEVFGRDVDRLKDLIRDPKGNDRIIDVIEHNDKDPVKSYFEGAKDFCKRLRVELGRRELSLVKNEYKGEDVEERSKEPSGQEQDKDAEKSSETSSPEGVTKDDSSKESLSGPAPGIPEKHP
ncbi:MAG: hypothetical protein ACLFTH_03990 [Candidatus Woesearchaeota archaeon]